MVCRSIIEGGCMCVVPLNSLAAGHALSEGPGEAAHHRLAVLVPVVRRTVGRLGSDKRVIVNMRIREQEKNR